MADVAVLIPVLGRPEQIPRVARSLAQSDSDGICRVVFICGHDDPTRLVCASEGHTMTIKGPRRRGDYQRKINAGFRSCPEPFVFTAATDLHFHPGWIEAVLARVQDDRPGVVGTRDGGNKTTNRGHHSTHSLVAREYVRQGAVIDAPGHLYSEAYDHNYCDQELVAYARWRFRYVSARDAYVEHLHPQWGKGEEDDVYRLGQATFRDDQRLFAKRRKLWQGETQQQRRRLARARLRGDVDL